ncbi:MAG: FtsX-like permease family protein [Acholeplasma sp.]|jgi:lipoprotein-releasing system permease protein|nr:FtsX-like permease family protein [Acholeplasma sp.]
MKLALNIAVRFLKSGKLQTLFIILGIGVGVSVQVFIGALISGLQKDLVNTTIGNASQITITSEDELPFSNYDTLIDDILNADKRLVVATPNLNVAGTLLSDTNTAPVLVRGFELASANEIYDYESKLVSGRMPQNDQEIILGNYFIDELGVNLNDVLTIEIPTLTDKQLTVVGFYDFEVKQINELWAISNLSTVQSLKETTDVVDQIETQIKDTNYFDAQMISPIILEAIGTGFVASDWMSNNASLLSGLQGQSISSLMIQVFVLISVVLGIASILAIIVLQKSKQIGILKAMGIKNTDASLIFLFEGLILGIFGAITGVLLGLFLLISFQTFAIDQATGDPVIPLFIDYGFIAVSALIAIGVATLAALIPARKSSKLSVIEVIRNA